MHSLLFLGDFRGRLQCKVRYFRYGKGVCQARLFKARFTSFGREETFQIAWHIRAAFEDGREEEGRGAKKKEKKEKDKKMVCI